MEATSGQAHDREWPASRQEFARQEQKLSAAAAHRVWHLEPGHRLRPLPKVNSADLSVPLTSQQCATFFLVLFICVSVSQHIYAVLKVYICPDAKGCESKV